VAQAGRERIHQVGAFVNDYGNAGPSDLDASRPVER
jgi:hypothetical protein